MQTLIIYANSVPHSEQCSHMQTVFRYTISVMIGMIKKVLTKVMIYVITIIKSKTLNYYNL